MPELTSFAPILPELVLAGGAVALLMLGVFREPAAGRLVGWLAILLLVAAGALVATAGSETRSLFAGAFVDDGFGRFMKILVFAGAAGAILLSFDFLAEARILKFEFFVLLLLSVVGMGLMISAGDLISLYVGLEMQSLALYVVAAFDRDNVRSSEAGLKYFVLGALSSGMLLYGCSLIYGFTGSTVFADIAATLTTGKAGIGLIFGMVFLLAGLAFKVSAVPFHMWVPDVYEGAPTPVTAFFAAAPKIAAFALMLRALYDAFPGIAPQWQPIIWTLSFASMVLGAFGAIGQRNIKRLMAYSSIGHVGFALVGLAAGTQEGVQGLLIYLAIYLAMTLGTFAAIIAMRRQSGPVEEIEALAGLARRDLPMAALLAVLLFSLAGIPPLAGFFAKFFVFLPAIKAGFYWLAVLGVVASVVGAYYYLRIVKVMFFDEPAEAFLPAPAAVRLVLTVASLLVLLYVVYPAPLIAAAGAAARTLF